MIEPLCAALTRGHEVRLILRILETLGVLLQLDEQYRESNQFVDTVSDRIEQADGTAHINRLVVHANSDVFKAAQELQSKLQRADGGDDAGYIMSNNGSSIYGVNNQQRMQQENGSGVDQSELAQIGSLFHIWSNEKPLQNTQKQGK